MERYFNDSKEIGRANKNQDLYNDIYNNAPSSDVALLDNESEIDINKLHELVGSREDYKKIKDYAPILKGVEKTEDEDYDIYEDIDNKIYDINAILEEAKTKKITGDREKYRNIMNTSFDILRNLDLDKNQDESSNEEMDNNFFTKDKTMEDLIMTMHNDDEKEKVQDDLFEDLKGNENTILTKPISDEQVVNAPKEETFYTNNLSFTKEDFEGFQNLQTTVKKNNKLIKILITVLTIILIALITFIAFVLL
jgi:hypothetical protein